MSKPVTVIATIQVKKAHAQEAERVLESLLAPTHAEDGCVKYALQKRIDQPGTFYFVELWDSLESLQKHARSTHLTTAMAEQSRLFERVDVATVEPVRAASSSTKGDLF